MSPSDREEITIAPGERGRGVMPHSEVCIHLQVAGAAMDFLLLPSGYAVQLFDDTGREFSFPISAGEAGIHFTHDGRRWYYAAPAAVSAADGSP